jgi:hypothetical protein
MTLTAGSTLQHGKYIIQTILHQSGFSITYQATHAYLEQRVIIQAFNESLRHHEKFDPLRQLFMAQIRRYAAAQPLQSPKILDGFEEDGMPFVVFRHNPDQPLPQLQDWLSLTKCVIPKPSQAVETDQTVSSPASVQRNSQWNGNHTLSQEVLATLIAVDTAASPTAVNPAARLPGESFSATTPVTNPPIAHRNGLESNGQKQRSPLAQFKPKYALPIALAMTAAVGGLAGASFGWLLRFEQPQEGTASESSTLFNFGQEQSFPPLENWPVTETADFPPLEDNWVIPEVPAPRRNRVRSAPRTAPKYEPPLVEEEVLPPKAEPMPEVEPLPELNKPLETDSTIEKPLENSIPSEDIAPSPIPDFQENPAPAVESSLEPPVIPDPPISTLDSPNFN